VRGEQPSTHTPHDASRLRIAVVVSRFNAFITDRLRDGAVDALGASGMPASQIEVFSVPGAFEIPQAARAVAETGRFDAVVCLGCLIRGETPHFDYIASATAHGITDAAGDTGVPMAFGVLTTNTTEQALERAGDGPDNKGREAAWAAIEMAELYRTLADRGARASGQPT
jgi:6,7-dimethyl-8-ribityllumazine synthase